MEDSEPLPYYSLDMTESEYNTEMTDSLSEFTMQTMSSRFSRQTGNPTDDINTSFSPSFIIASEKALNENTESILTDINKSSYLDSKNKRQSFPTVSAMNTTTNGINFIKRPSSNSNNLNGKLKTKESNESLTTSISSISNLRSIYNLAPSVYDNYYFPGEMTEGEEEEEEEEEEGDNANESNEMNQSNRIMNSMNQMNSFQGNPLQMKGTPQNHYQTTSMKQPQSQQLQQQQQQQSLKSPYLKANSSNGSNLQNNTSTAIDHTHSRIEYIPPQQGIETPNGNSLTQHATEKLSLYSSNNNTVLNPSRNEIVVGHVRTPSHGHGLNAIPEKVIVQNSGKEDNSNIDNSINNSSKSEIKRTSYNKMLLEIHDIENENVISNGLTDESGEIDSSYQDNSYYNQSIGHHSKSLIHSINEQSKNLHTLSVKNTKDTQPYHHYENNHRIKNSNNNNNYNNNNNNNYNNNNNNNYNPNISYSQKYSNQSNYPNYSNNNPSMPSSPSPSMNSPHLRSKNESAILSPVSASASIKTQSKSKFFFFLKY